MNLLFLLSLAMWTCPYRQGYSPGKRLYVHTDLPIALPVQVLLPLLAVLLATTLCEEDVVMATMAAMISVRSLTYDWNGLKPPKIPGKVDTCTGHYPFIEVLAATLKLSVEGFVLHTLPVDPRWLDKAEHPKEHKGINCLIKKLLDDKHTVIHYRNQLKWVFLTHENWDKGTYVVQSKLFGIRKGLTAPVAAEKVYKRMCTFIITDTRYHTWELPGLGIAIRTESYFKNKLDKIYPHESEMFKREMLDKIKQHLDGVTLASPAGVRQLGDFPTENGQVGDALRIAFKAIGIAKGNLVVLKQLRVNFVVFEWNITKELVPSFEMLRITKACAKTRPSTDWQSMVMHVAMTKYFPQMVEMYYKEVLEKANSTEELIGKLQELRNVEYPPAEMEQEEIDEIEEEMIEEIDNLIEFLRSLPPQLNPFAIKEIRSKMAKLFGGGSEKRKTVARYSIPYPKGWATCGKLMPDISGIMLDGMFNPKVAQLKKGEVFVPGLPDGEKVALYRWPVGSPREIVFATNRVTPYYETVGQCPICINMYDSAEWCRTLGGADFDDTVIAVHHKPIVKDLWDNREYLPSYKSADTSLLDEYTKVCPVATQQLTWETAARYNVQLFKDGTIVGIGLFASILGRIIVVLRSLGDFRQRGGAAFLYRTPTTKRTWEKCVTRQDIYRQKLYCWTPNGTLVSTLGELLDTFERMLPCLRILFVPGIAEKIIDAANQKPKKVPGEKYLDVYPLLMRIWRAYKKASLGPKGAWTRGGFKFFIEGIDAMLFGQMPGNALYEDYWGYTCYEDTFMGRKQSIAPAQLVPSHFNEPADHVRELRKAGYHFVDNKRKEIGIYIKTKLRPIMDEWLAKGKFNDLAAALWQLGTADYSDPQPTVYVFNENRQWYNNSAFWFEQWVKTVDDNTRCQLEGAINIQKRYNAKLLKALWEVGVDSALPTCNLKPSKEALKVAKEIMNGWHEATMKDSLYSKEHGYAGEQSAVSAYYLCKQLKIKHTAKPTLSPLFLEEHLGKVLIFVKRHLR